LHPVPGSSLPSAAPWGFGKAAAHRFRRAGRRVIDDPRRIRKTPTRKRRGLSRTPQRRGKRPIGWRLCRGSRTKVQAGPRGRGFCAHVASTRLALRVCICCGCLRTSITQMYGFFGLWISSPAAVSASFSIATCRLAPRCRRRGSRAWHILTGAASSGIRPPRRPLGACTTRRSMAE
jgi:hypothetical protein